MNLTPAHFTHSFLHSNLLACGLRFYNRSLEEKTRQTLRQVKSILIHGRNIMQSNLRTSCEDVSIPFYMPFFQHSLSPEPAHSGTAPRCHILYLSPFILQYEILSSTIYVLIRNLVFWNMLLDARYLSILIGAPYHIRHALHSVCSLRLRT